MADDIELIGGVEHREIVVVPHDPAWAGRFAVEEARIRAALGERAVRVDHVGSTAVPGLAAKPIVDIDVSVADVEDETSYLPDLLAAGYELRVREPGHRLVRTPARDVHVHVCGAGSDWEQRHLAFRDRLRSDDADRDAYAALKLALAEQDWPDMNAYSDAKGALIAEILNRDSYDRVAADYADLLDDELDRKPLDRAVLATFAELVLGTGQRQVADVGCGPGRIAAHLHDLGLDVRGIDLSPGMVAVARARHPALVFDVGDVRSLDVPTGTLVGVVAWYSTVHTPLDELPVVLAELRRVLQPGGQALLAFKAGAGVVHLPRAYGHPVSLAVHRHDPARVEELLAGAGLVVHTRVVREPDEQESTPQAYLLASAR